VSDQRIASHCDFSSLFQTRSKS